MPEKKHLSMHHRIPGRGTGLNSAGFVLHRWIPCNWIRPYIRYAKRDWQI